MQTFPQVSVYIKISISSPSSHFSIYSSLASTLMANKTALAKVINDLHIFKSSRHMLSLNLLVFSVGVNTVGHSPSRITYFLGFHDIALSKLPLTF